MRPQALVLDIDGVLRVGGVALPGASALLSHLEKSDFPYHIITNHPFLDLELKLCELARQGLAVKRERISGAADPMGELIQGLKLKSRRVYATCCEEAGPFFSRLGLEVDNGVPPEELGAIILLDDDHGWTMDRVAHVFNMLLRVPSLPLIVPNCDMMFPQRPGWLMLTSGAVAKWLTDLCALRGVTVSPIHLGKPFPPLFRMAERLIRTEWPEVKKEGIFMVGDSLESDIKGAIAVGWGSILLCTGNTFSAQHESDSVATVKCRDISGLMEHMGWQA